MNSPPAPAREAVGSALIRGGLWLGSIFAIGYHLALELATVRLSEPMGMWETVYASIAKAWPLGYQWTHFVDGHDNYGPGYPAFCRLFLGLGLENYVAHRVANLAAIAGACGLLAWILRKNGCAARIVIAVTAIFYALNAGSYSIQARPDFLLLLLIVGILALGQFIAAGRGRTVGTGLALGVLALAAYWVKPYAIIAWGSVVAYLAIFSRGPRALGVGLWSAGVWVGGVAWYAAFNPLYWMETFLAHVALDSPSGAWFLHQAGDFFLLSFGLVAGVALAIGARARPKAPEDFRTESPRPTAIGGRLDPAWHYWAWCALLALLALGCSLGWHTGAYLTYYFHLLLTPLAVLAALRASAVEKRLGFALPELLLLSNLCLLMVWAPPFPRPDRGWEELREDVRTQQGRVLVDSLMEPFSRGREKVEVSGTGMTANALREPFLLSTRHAVVLRARAEAAAFEAEQKRRLFQEEPPDVIYLDCVFIGATGAGGRGLAPALRSNLPYLTAAQLADYAPAAIFRVHPYYSATNERRQEAGSWETSILKLVRKKR